EAGMRCPWLVAAFRSAKGDNEAGVVLREISLYQRREMLTTMRSAEGVAGSVSVCLIHYRIAYNRGFLRFIQTAGSPSK
ncbi:MAG: hypothetical protein L0Z53_20605, partial [Acidobacteriales bacterium]|nr:hypothetical protein [Terriglobales bacterium]